MRISKQCVMFSLLILSTCYDELMAADLPCGDWEPYKDERCIKVFDETKTFDDAVMSCQKQNSSALISIHSLEEQEFFSNLLFKTHKVVDAVWIGLKYVSNKFKWSDGTDVSFTNWAEGSPSKTTNKACVQIISDGSLIGKWADEPCNKKNLVVCQKMQTWSLSRLQQTLLDARKEYRNALNDLRQNPVPIGFIYVQLPSQPDPKSLWSAVQWTDVTSYYAGLFFRAEGGDSAGFGTLQSAHAPYRYITGVQTVNFEACNYAINYNIPSNGWSSYFQTGFLDIADHYRNICMKFQTSSENGEVRPINKAVRIWKRTS